MQVQITRCVDASDPDAEGKHDWIYEYDLIRFVEDESSLVARSYVDTPDEASLVRLESASGVETCRPEHLELPLVRKAVRWLRRQGKLRVGLPGGQAGVDIAQGGP